MKSKLNFAENYMPSFIESWYKLEKLGRPYWNSVNKLLCRSLPFTVIYIVYCEQPAPVYPISVGWSRFILPCTHWNMIGRSAFTQKMICFSSANFSFVKFSNKVIYKVIWRFIAHLQTNQNFSESRYSIHMRLNKPNALRPSVMSMMRIWEWTLIIY